MAHTTHATVEERLAHIEDVLHHQAEAEHHCYCHSDEAGSETGDSGGALSSLIIDGAAQALESLTIIAEHHENESAVHAAEVLLDFFTTLTPVR